MAATSIAPAACTPVPKMESEHTLTVLLTSFAGLGLPRTLSLPVLGSTTIHDVLETVYSLLPHIDQPLIITTTSNKQLLLSNHQPISTFLSDQTDTFLPLRLSTRLCGGKGGFGSQLRAAGGRMSSRKNRNANENPNGSNRNLDGRRLRTIDAAKRLAEYLATKPEMEVREREEQKKRWQAVVDAAERREEDIKKGKSGAGQGRLDAEYVESKELAEERTREAVMKAVREHGMEMQRTGSESSMEVEEEEGSGDEAEVESSESSEDAKVEKEDAGRTFFGWDEDEDEDEDDPEEDDDASSSETQPSYEGKGKGKAS